MLVWPTDIKTVNLSSFQTPLSLHHILPTLDQVELLKFVLKFNKKILSTKRINGNIIVVRPKYKKCRIYRTRITVFLLKKNYWYFSSIMPKMKTDVSSQKYGRVLWACDSPNEFINFKNLWSAKRIELFLFVKMLRNH